MTPLPPWGAVAEGGYAAAQDNCDFCDEPSVKLAHRSHRRAHRAIRGFWISVTRFGALRRYIGLQVATPPQKDTQLTGLADPPYSLGVSIAAAVEPTRAVTHLRCARS